MAVVIDKHSASASVLFLMQEWVENGLAISSVNQWEIPLEDFCKLSEEELLLLNFPQEAPAELHVSIHGILTRWGARFEWYVKTQNGNYSSERVKIPILDTVNGQVCLPHDISRAIELLDWFQNEGDGVRDQFELINGLQGLEGVKLPPELMGKSFLAPKALVISPELDSERGVTLGLEIPGQSEEICSLISKQVDRKSRLVKRSAEMVTTLRVAHEKGEVNIAFEKEASHELKRLGEIRARSFNRAEFVGMLKADPTLGFNPDLVDLSAFSERVLRLGLFQPAPEVVYKWSGNQWIPLIECRNYSGELKHLAIQNAEDLSKLDYAISKAKSAGLSLVDYEGEEFGLSEAIELYQLCERQLNAPEEKVPEGRLIPIIDEQLVKPLADLALDSLSYAPPPHLAQDICLLDHQKLGVGWLQALCNDATVRGALLADDMGLGKTIQVLSFIHWHRQEQENQNSNKPYLIIAPVALLSNWVGENTRFFPSGELTTVVLHGRTSRDLHTHELSRNLLIITNYETLSNQILTWARVDWAVVTLDEAQQIKNPQTFKSQAARSLKSDFNIALTGTPVENELLDLWTLMDFVEPGLLGTQKQFKETYSPEEIGKKEFVALRDRIGMRMLRRLKQDVLDLPAKFLYPSGWTGSGFHPWSKEMSVSQHQAYHDLVHFFKGAEFKNHNQRQSSVLSTIQGFRALTDHPYVADKRLIPILESSIEELIEKSAKLQVTIKLLREIQAQGEKAIVFSGLRLSQQLLRRVIQDVFNVHTPVVNGETPVSASRAEHSRQGIIDEFNNTDGFGVVILSPLAAGVGLNVTSANHVIHFTRHWNPAKESQATDRAYRIGQKKPVHVYFPMSLSEKFESFDAVLHRLLVQKQELAEDALTPTRDFNERDFIQMLGG
jgi:hypothetical protein